MIITTTLILLKPDAEVRLFPKIDIICWSCLRGCTGDNRSKLAEKFQIMSAFVAVKRRHLCYDFL